MTRHEATDPFKVDAPTDPGEVTPLDSPAASPTRAATG